MSETKSQPTPEVDAEIERRLRLRYHETPEKIPHVEASFARSLEISRDQWKAVAERLANFVKKQECHCYKMSKCTKCQALTEFNQLKSK